MNHAAIQLLCLDIDGTLLDSQHQLPERNRAAIQQAAQAHVTVCLTSARPPAAVVPILRELNIEHDMICYNGGLILHKEQMLSEQRIPVSVGVRIVQEAQRCGISVSVYRGWDWLIERDDPWSEQERAITGTVPVSVPLVETMRQWQEGAHKLLCMGPAQQIDAVTAVLAAQQLPVQLVRSKDTYLEILPPLAEKGVALQAMCRKLGIPVRQSMAMGDHDNDCGMLRAAGLGVAMGNGSAAAKAAADVCTSTNDDAGVARAIDTWILHKEGAHEI